MVRSPSRHVGGDCTCDDSHGGNSHDHGASIHPSLIHAMPCHSHSFSLCHLSSMPCMYHNANHSCSVVHDDDDDDGGQGKCIPHVVAGTDVTLVVSVQRCMADDDATHGIGTASVRALRMDGARRRLRGILVCSGTPCTCTCGRAGDPCFCTGDATTDESRRTVGPAALGMVETSRGRHLRWTSSVASRGLVHRSTPRGAKRREADAFDPWLVQTHRRRTERRSGKRRKRAELGRAGKTSRKVRLCHALLGAGVC